MDKVIIDGVDVSECSYAITPKRQCPNKSMPYSKKTSCISCKEHNTKLNFCKNNPDCYFKQLQRLKEELRTEKIYSSQIEELEESLQHDKEENERLKARLRPLEDSYFKGLSSIEIAELAKKSIRVTAENRKLEYALQEIRDIILSPEIIDEETKKLHTSEELDNIVRWHREDKLSKIKAKINEVIGAE